jgi:hypothetical protein
MLAPKRNVKQASRRKRGRCTKFASNILLIPAIYPRVRSVWIILTKRRVHAASAPYLDALPAVPITATSSCYTYNKADGASPAHTKGIYVCPDHRGWLCTEACVNLSLGTLGMMFVGWFAGLYIYFLYLPSSLVRIVGTGLERPGRSTSYLGTLTPVAAPTSGAGKHVSVREVLIGR